MILGMKRRCGGFQGNVFLKSRKSWQGHITEKGLCFEPVVVQKGADEFVSQKIYGNTRVRRYGKICNIQTSLCSPIERTIAEKFKKGARTLRRCTSGYCTRTAGIYYVSVVRHHFQHQPQVCCVILDLILCVLINFISSERRR